MARVIASTSPARARSDFAGYGELVKDPDGIVDLPPTFRYRIFSRAGEPLSSTGTVPSDHDGMAAFSGDWRGIYLVRNHELNPIEIAVQGKVAVGALDGATYDPEAPGGTTTLFVSRDRELIDHRVSLSGTYNNCAGGPTPWRTWLTCEETEDILAKPHGYVFEVDPRRGGNPEPIVGMGRFSHEAVAFDRQGRAYLSEDASGPHGCMYRFEPQRALEGRGSLHAGGVLTALCVGGVNGDLSAVQEPGTVLPVYWVPVPNSNPGAGDVRVREQVLELGATAIRKAEGVWRGFDGCIWFVSSYADGPSGSSPTSAEHSGQIWCLDPRRDSIELVAFFPRGSAYDGPDNITVSPHGYAIACTDGDDDQWLVGIGDDGGIFPFAFNALNDEEFAGATFSPSGRTLFVNIQNPGLTLAIWGRW